MEERLTAIVGARITEFKRKMAEANAISKTVATGITKEIDANARPFFRKAAEVLAAMKAIDGKRVIVTFEARSQNFKREIDRLADWIRDLQVVTGNMFKGSMWTMFPTLSPIIAAGTGAAATAGVSIGILGGQLLGLMSGFTLAAAGAGAFAGIMIPTITNIKMARTEINEGRKAMEDYSKPMQRAIKAQDKMNSAWLYMNEAIEPQVLGTLSAGMESVSILIDKLSPGIKLVADAFEGLMGSMKNAINNAPDMQRNFGWFNERAAGAVTAWGEIAGYALRGFFNLMRAFDPLAQTMETGLLNMTKRFSEWADGLGKSEKFQKFIEYVQTNGPKLGAIFGNIVVGLVNLFSAFGPLAADMLTGFQDMTARFREWSGALSENQAFQDFVAHIRENGPKVIDLIGNLTDFLVQIGIAMAPIGSFLLDVANGFLNWATGMMKAHPIASNIMVALFSLAGVFRMLVPVFLLFKNMFGGVFTYIWKMFVPFKGALTQGLSMIMQSFGRFITSIVSFIPRIGGVLLKAVTGIGGFFGRIIFMLGEFAVIMGQALFKAIGVIGKFAGRFIGFLGRILIQGLLWAARMVAMWFIAMGPIGWVILAIGALVAFIIWKWDWVKSVSIKVWTAVWNWIVNVWNMIVQAVSLAAQLVVEYVKSKFNSALNTTKTVWNAVKSFISNVWNNIKSFVQSAVSNVVDRVKTGFNNAKNNVISIWNAIKTAIQNAWNAIKTFVTTAVNNVKTAVQNGFNAARDTIRNIMNNIRDAIRNTWKNIVNAIRNALSNIKNNISNNMNEILGFIKGLGSSFLAAGKGLIEMMAKGITAGIGKVTGAVKNVAAKVRNFLPFSPAKVGPLSDLDKLDFGNPIKDSIIRASSIVQRQMGNMLSVPNFAPLDVATPSSISVPTVNVPEAKASTNEASSTNQPATFNFRLGKRSFTAFVDDVTQTQKELELRERREAGN